MKFTRTAVRDVVLVEPRVFADPRGMFMETWNSQRFEEAGISARFVQHNHSLSVRGILRGLHYQIRQPQGKLVRVVRGAVHDVVVDLRRSSPTFGRWEGFVLSAENRLELWVPPGLAHGFYVISGAAEFVYSCTDYYAPEHERTLCWNDPELGIDWPLDAGGPPLLSEKDLQGLPLSQAECYP